MKFERRTKEESCVPCLFPEHAVSLGYKIKFFQVLDEILANRLFKKFWHSHRFKKVFFIRSRILVKFLIIFILQRIQFHRDWRGRICEHRPSDRIFHRLSLSKRKKKIKRALFSESYEIISKIVDATCVIAFHSWRDYLSRPPVSLSPRLPQVGTLPAISYQGRFYFERSCPLALWLQTTPFGAAYLRHRQADRRVPRDVARAKGRRRLTRLTAISIVLACVWRRRIASLSYFLNAVHLYAFIPSLFVISVVIRTRRRLGERNFVEM